MNFDQKLGKTASVLFLALAMAGCGGGSGEVAVDVNTGPSLMLGTGASIDEGTTGTTGLTVTATDEEGDEVAFQVDDPRFDVVGGVLTIVAGTMLDYETERSITVGITASDGELMSDTMTAVVMVGNVDDNEPTMSTSGTRGNIIEGETGGTGVTFMVDDNDMLGNLMFSTDVEGFSVIPLGGGRYELVVDEELDREDMAEVRVVVTATDDTGSVMSPTLTIAVGNVDDTAPMLGIAGMGEINENEAGVDTGVEFRPTDADDDTMFTFYVEGANRESFRVVPAGFRVYALQVTDAFDYESDGGTVDVTVTVVDSAGLSDSATFSVMVNDLNDNAPMVTTMGSAAIDEEQTGSTMLKLGVMDPDTIGDAPMWTVDDNRFAINADGYLVLKEGEALDYDGADGVMSVPVQVTASDGTNVSMPINIMVSINAVNDNTPVITVAGTQVALNEGMFDAAMSTGFTVSVADGDGDMPSPMVVDDDRFTITDGNLVIAAGSSFDYEMKTDQSVSLTITANDGANDAEARKTIVRFMDVNDNAPMLTVTDNKDGTAVNVVNLDEGEVSADYLTDHKVAVSDADSGEAPTPMVSDPRFKIDENGYLMIKAGESFNFEEDADKSIELQITADDGENMVATYTITFNIANVDEPPTIEGNQKPELVMGPRGDGKEDVTTLTATDPDNPDEPFVVRWSVTENPNEDVWEWKANDAGNKYTLKMKQGTFLGQAGPGAQAAAANGGEAVAYTGYTADDAGVLPRHHLVDVDDAELDKRAPVQVMQKVDTIETSPALDMYGTYSRTVGEGAAAVTTVVLPSFDELTDAEVVKMGTDNRVLNDEEMTAGATRTTAATGGTVPMVPVEPDALDIVTDTRAVDITTGAIKAGQELAIRYRFASDGVADVDETRDYNVDVALIGNSGMVLEEYRDAGAYATAFAAETLTESMSSIEVDASNTSGGGTLSFAKYGLWAYNNLRMCSTCPQGPDGYEGGGLRGATAFGLMARPGDLDTQDHVGVWDGTTVAMWGNKAADGSIDPAMLQSSITGGTAKIAVNFHNNEVQANMAVANHRFEFDGTLNADHLGYTAMVNTTIPGGGGAIETTAGNAGELSNGHVLSVDSADNVHATGSLSGAFYGPTSAVSSTVANAKASAETAGTWQITDVPHVASPDAISTIVIGAFGASLSGNVRIDSSEVGGIDLLKPDPPGDIGTITRIGDDE